MAADAMQVLSLQQAGIALGIRKPAAVRRYLHARGAVLTVTGTGDGTRYRITRGELERVCPQLSSDLTDMIRAQIDGLHAELEGIRAILVRHNLT